MHIASLNTYCFHVAKSLIQWRRYDETRGKLMKAELEKLAATKLSDDLYEIVTRGLK
jgi:aminopeptidase N